MDTGSCVPPLCWYFSFYHKMSIELRSLWAQSVYLSTNVRGPISHHRRGSVGVPAACRALCGLLYSFTSWARPECADEVPGEQTLLHRKTSPFCIAAAVVAGFAPLSYYYCCSCSLSADRRESTSSVHWVMAKHVSGEVSEHICSTDCGSTTVSLDILK